MKETVVQGHRKKETGRERIELLGSSRGRIVRTDTGIRKREKDRANTDSAAR